jgi:hypothetical protein
MKIKAISIYAEIAKRKIFILLQIVAGCRPRGGIRGLRRGLA